MEKVSRIGAEKQKFYSTVELFSFSQVENCQIDKSAKILHEVFKDLANRWFFRARYGK